MTIILLSSLLAQSRFGRLHDTNNAFVNGNSQINEVALLAVIVTKNLVHGTSVGQLVASIGSGIGIAIHHRVALKVALKLKITFAMVMLRL